MKIAVIGGDKRMLFAARAFADLGHEVYLAGFDHLVSLCEIRVCTVEEAVQNSDIVVLPVRPAADGNLNAPFSALKINLSALAELTGERAVFSGCAERIAPYFCGAVYDYTAREDFAFYNAELTAEAAVGLMISEYEGSVSGTEVLVTGYGRIGKLLSAQLSAMGAKVTAAARKPSDRMLAMENGLAAVDYPEIDYGRYRVIYNTVPAPVLGEGAVDSMREDVFIFDLASAPGGVDDRRVEERGLSCIHALSLPGKTSPLAAGIIIRDTILKILSECNHD